MTTYKPVGNDTAKSLIGEGIHTAFRKAIDSPQSGVVWNGIRELPEGEWDAVLDWLVWCLAEMDYVLCERRG